VSAASQTELDRLDPPPSRPRRPPPRQKGDNETAVLRDLKALPEDLRRGGLAVLAVTLAKELDAGGMSARDTAAVAGQLRMALVTLREIAPGESRGDHTDEVRARREKRLSAAGE
jgi:hypothetical protein